MLGLRGLCEAPLCALSSDDVIRIEQDLNIIQDVSIDIFTRINQSFVLLQTLSANLVYNQDIEHDIDLTQDVDVLLTYGIDVTQALNFVQQITYIYSENITQSLTIGQDVLYDYSTVIQQLLELTQSHTLTYIAGLNVEQSLTLSQTIAIQRVYNMLLCHCLSLTQKVSRDIQLEITQNLTLTLTQREVLEQLLVLVQQIETNMDDYTCCNPSGNSGGRLGVNDIIFSQSVLAQSVYNVEVVQNLGLLNTTAWRP